MLITQSLESPSGQGRYFPLAKALVSLGFSVSMIALHPNFSSLRAKHFEQEGVEVYYVAQMHVRKTPTSKTYFGALGLMWIASQATFAMVRALIRSHCDVLFIGKPHPMNVLAGNVVAKYRNLPTILDCDDDEVATNRFAGAWQRAIVGYFERHAPARARMLTTNTSYMAKKLCGFGLPPSRIICLSNGVDTSRFAAVDLKQVDLLRHQLNLVTKKVVTYVGSLSSASHPVLLLLEAFALVHQGEPSACLLVVGGGEDYKALQLKVEAIGLKEVVLFCGRVAGDLIPNYYALSDVSVDPVNDDVAARARSPLKLFESWASAVPFVSGDVGDRRSLLGEPPAGVLVRPGDAAALAGGILQVLSDPEFAHELTKRGLERVKSFDWNVLGRILANTCEHVAH